MTTALFAISTYCQMHNVEHTFIDSLRNEGLISITSGDEGEFIGEEQLHELEIYTRWYHDLGINPEGIDAIRHMVSKIRELQTEVSVLRTRLRVYEEGGNFT